ncbi:STE24 endopeptidase [Malonomonas rubra DSM 5091]|uniref:STE24 endopeptidase n=1 Tax=Malonomonas rubra DSM 5091 TaxID=1122189 RepID=A0A1M6EYW5_MALRU|nr:M48 family metallopeptidase [Malonomonas rubra]SHI90581.1 STE24 endopeptidase [Malonomonas rubra DSM 5091]
MKILLLIIYLLVTAMKFFLDWLNLRHRQQQHPPLPQAFVGQIDAERMAKSDAYALAGDKFGFIEDGFGFIVSLLFLFGGILPWYDNWASEAASGFVANGLLFFGLLLLVQMLLGVPFSLYRNFVLEEKFGFNKMSFRLWCVDTIKSLLIGGALFVVLAGGALWLVNKAPQSWWLWVWGFWGGMTLFLMYVSPYLIEPLFFKFSPLEKESLEDGVRELLDKAGVKAGKVLQVDASRRSGHSNAYFTGIGKVKRVVLFDTLMEQLEDKELLAVLAHELGHWRCGHIRKRLIKSQLVALFSCLVAFKLLNADWLPGLLGLEQLSFAGRVLLLGWLASLLSFFWTPISSWFSRRDERQADQFAIDLVGSGRELASGLVKLARENLSSLFPHPLYVAIYYSHPDLVTRVKWLEGRKPSQAK